MIFEFTKKLTLLGSDYPIYNKDHNLLFTIDFIKNGFVFNNPYNKLIAQAIKDKNGVTISIADSPSIFIDKSLNILPTTFNDNNLDKDVNLAKKRSLNFSYQIFGNPCIYSYDLFQKKHGQIKPEVIANIIDCPLNEKLFKVRIDESKNLIKILCIIFSINMLI